MASGHKRQRDDPNVQPASKRVKHPWPRKQKQISDISQLPTLLNPSFHKNIFQQFWRKKGWGKPELSLFLAPPSTANRPLFQCRLCCTNPKNEEEEIVVISTDFESKKKATVDAYLQFNLQYIPHDMLCRFMKPFSKSKSKGNALDNGQRYDRGAEYENRSATIEIEPVPLEMHEADAIALLYSNQADKSKIDSHSLVRHIAFSAVAPGSIYKKLWVQFHSMDVASKFVRFLDGKRYKTYQLRATWRYDLKSAQYLKPGRYLKVLGLPMDLRRGAVTRYLGSLGVFPKDFVRCDRYSLFLELLLEFKEPKETREAFTALKDVTFAGVRKPVTARRLYARYALSTEFEEARKYGDDIGRKFREVAKSSNSVDVEGVSWNTKMEHIKKAFQRVGKVERVELMPRKDLSPGSAYVVMATRNDAVQAVLKMNGLVLNGTALRVQIHYKQSLEDKQRVRAWYAKREVERAAAARAVEEEKKKTRKRNNKKKRLKRNGKPGRGPYKPPMTNRPDEQQANRDHDEWG